MGYAWAPFLPAISAPVEEWPQLTCPVFLVLQCGGPPSSPVPTPGLGQYLPPVATTCSS